MGAEADCRVELNGDSSDGRALLETHELIFRGDFRLRVPFKTISSLASVEGRLTIGFGDNLAVFHLGNKADDWAHKIKNPKGRLDKLGIKPGHKISVVSLDDDGFIAELRTRTLDVSTSRPRSSSDAIFLGAADKKSLSRLPTLRKNIMPGGALWVVRAKGHDSPLKENDIIAAAKEHGLVDVKVVSFSETHSALKLVIPLDQR
ncbi:MAG: DUF3052 domain-containing protein [Actinomycetota bacterium]|nr:DUF3052 domain-containing protein [Actinomycetota bacterium]